MKSHCWFDWLTPGDGQRKRPNPIWKLLVGGAVGALFLALHHEVLAALVWLITAVIVSLAYLSPGGYAKVERCFAALGRVVGRGVAVTLLTPVLLLVFPILRLWLRLAHRDPLHLRDRERHTFWLECDGAARKRRYASSMFASERIAARPSARLAFVTSFLLLIALAELGLRFMGIGNPILYIDDPVLGYYPAPNQCIQRFGGNTVVTNEFGMRAPSYSAAKPEGHFRIFMLGDSTLWGGSYVDQDEIYARLLEQHLTADSTVMKAQVLNMGVNGWGPYHKLGYVERFGAFEADLAVICLPIRDLYRPLSRLSELPYFHVQSPPRLALEEVFLKLVWRYHSRLTRFASKEGLAAQVERGTRTYLELADCLRGLGCEVLFEILPSRTAATSMSIPEEERMLVERFREALVAEGHRVGYPAGFAAGLAGHDPSDIYHDECHLHRRGHRLYAEYLMRRISEQSHTFEAWNGAYLMSRTETRAGL